MRSALTRVCTTALAAAVLSPTVTAAASEYEYRIFAKGLLAAPSPTAPLPESGEPVPPPPPLPQYDLVTWSPTDKAPSVSVSEDRLTADVPMATWIRASMGKAAGKWYWEVVPTGTAYIGAGVATDAAIPNLADTRQAYSIWGTGYYCNYGCSGAYEWAKFKSGDVLGFALDASNRSLQFYVNGVYRQTVATPAGTIYPAAGGWANGSYLGKFKGANWSHQPPPGYLPLE